jgi:hypothetical protein
MRLPLLSASAAFALVAATALALLGTSARGADTPPPPPPAPVTSPAPLAPLLPAQTADSRAALGVRLDCLHNFNLDKGESQGCLTLSGLRIGVDHRAAPTVRAAVRIDPYATPISSRSLTSYRVNLPGPEDTRLGIIDDYALTWTPRPNLEIAVESYDGAARVPSVSGLSLAGSLADTGWKQTALTVTYNLATLRDMRVTFAVGNGEGENGRNLDPQQYFGFEASAYLSTAVKAVIGVSMDGNSAGSEEYPWLLAKWRDECGVNPAVDGVSKLGWSTQRLAAGIILDGTLPGAEGLEAGLGWQRNVFSDLDKQRRSAPNKAELAACPVVDVDTIFVEDAAGEEVNTVQRTTWVFNMRYRLLSQYFVGIDWTTRRTDTGSVNLFEVCDGYTDSTCSAPSGDTRNGLSQDAYTAGFGVDLASALTLSLEYHRASFDKKYTQAFYFGQEGKASEQLELFNARLAYAWQ